MAWLVYEVTQDAVDIQKGAHVAHQAHLRKYPEITPHFPCRGSILETQGIYTPCKKRSEPHKIGSNHKKHTASTKKTGVTPKKGKWGI